MLGPGLTRTLGHELAEISDFLAAYPAPVAAHAQRLPKLVIEFTRGAARIAAMSRGERQLLTLARLA